MPAPPSHLQLLAPALSRGKGMPSLLRHRLLPLVLLFPLTQNRVWVVGAPSPVLLSLGSLHAEIALTMGYPVPGRVLLIYLSGATVRLCSYRRFPPACVAVWLNQSMSIIPSSHLQAP